MEARNKVFQQLKPSCIALSQSLLAFGARQGNGVQVVACLENLLLVTENSTKPTNNLDEKLADYIFFPISQVLKASQNLPVRAMELCLQVLTIVISGGWRQKISVSLSAQLIIFLSLTCDTSGSIGVGSHVTDELRAHAFNCMSKLFDALRSSAQGKSSLIDTANIPSLGHAVTIIIGGISTGESYDVQRSALEALESLLSCIEDIQVLSSFFPGIVSNLTKVLTPSTQSRRHWKVLLQSIQVLSTMLLSVASDRASSQLCVQAETGHGELAARLDTTWIQTTAAQLKLALANINRLRSHDRIEVRDAVREFNLMILIDCKTTLQECCTMALETVLLLTDASSSGTDMRLESMVQTDATMAELLVKVFHDEFLSQVRIMQSNDDDAKEKSVRKVFAAFAMLSGSEIDTRVISRTLGNGLRDSLTTLMQSSVSKRVTHVAPLMLSEMLPIQGENSGLHFSMPFVQTKGQETLLRCIKSSIQDLKLAHPSIRLSSDLIASLRSYEGDAQVITFWLILCDIETTQPGEDVDRFLNFESVPDDSDQSLQEQLYSFSIDVLQEEDSDWRLKALALEGVALYAQRRGQEFRPELTDALYPVLYQLGSGNEQVCNHAMRCINLVSDACGYAEVQDLIVANVDYLVNAVALKLNAFDVSPQGPQVLLMMVQLAGPSLLPYLEDTLDSIFAALEDYHGYTALVELLFSVLKTMAEEGAKAPQLSITDHSDVDEEVKFDSASTNVQDLVKHIRQLGTKSVDPKNDPTWEKSFPPTSWKDPKASSKATGAMETDQDNSADDSRTTEQPPPAAKTYNLLLKITQLTQHYLSSSSPSLRSSLLSLINTTIPALARHENSFLPLINTLWPEVTSRLFDDEAHVVSGSLKIIGLMCQYSGGFMRSRIHSLWTELTRVHRRLRSGAKTEYLRPHTRSGDAPMQQLEISYVDTTSRAVWQNFMDLLIIIVNHVDIDAEMFEDVLRMLHPVGAADETIREALEKHNPDATWLARLKEGSCVMESSRLDASGDWHFVGPVR